MTTATLTPSEQLEIADGFAPDSVYAELSAEERAISDRLEDEHNHRWATTLELRSQNEGFSIKGLRDDALRRLAKQYRRQIEDIDDGDLNDSKTGYRRRMVAAKLADIEAEQEFRAALAESWLAADHGTHSYTGYAGRGGLKAVVENGAEPPSYWLAAKLDRRNFDQGEPSVFEWEKTG